MKLNDDRAEQFCQLYVKGGMSPADACYKAGYGGTKNQGHKTSYHSVQASKLLSQKPIILRIEELKEELENEHKTDVVDVVSYLMYGLLHDPTQHMKVVHGVSKEGIEIQNVIIDPADKDFSKWDKSERQLIDHFDPKTGNPVYISKQYCLEKLLKYFHVDDDQTEEEDLESLLENAGLFAGKKIRGEK